MGIYHSSEPKAIPKIVNKTTGKVTVDSHIQWEWQSNAQPWNSDQVQEWTSYPKETIEILERAFREKQTKVEIGEYIADFETFCQYHKADNWRIRPLRRVDLKKRVWRFCSELSTFKTFNQAPYSENPPLVEKWLNNRVFNFKVDSQGYNITDGENQKVLQEIANLALIGISEEAEKNNCKECVKPIIDRLQPIITKNQKMIFRGFILAYTMETIKEGESFYSMVNRALRDDDLSKADTLGPFCYLLNLALKSLSYDIESESSFSGTVYRGLTIEEGLLDYYKKAMKRGLHISLQPFISATRSKDLANLYLSKEEWERKVLLLIENAKGTNAEVFTAHEYEQEVILPAGSSYEIVEIKEEELITIRLKMIDVNLVKSAGSEPIALACNSLNILLDYFDNLEQMKKPNFNVDEGGMSLTPQSKLKELEEYVLLAAEGIENMALESDEEKVKAKEIAQELRKVMMEAPESIFKLILKQLTMYESLRNQVNSFIQKGKNDERKELEPFIYLLLSYFRALKKEVKENAEPKAKIDYVNVERNVDLSSGDLELYKELFAKKLHFVYNAFLSALKKKGHAGNGKKVLIDIEIPEEMLPGFEVTGVHGSVYKEQVLLPPGLNFEILDIKEENEGLLKISLRFVDYELLANDKL